MSKYETNLFQYFQNLKRQILLTPLNLGGTASGSGGPPGSFLGYLPQNRVSYDSVEASISGFSMPSPYNPSGILISGSLIDNMNHIRYRIAVLEGLGFSAGSFRVEENQVLIASGITILNFEGALNVTNSGPGEVTILASGSLTDEKTKVSSDDTTANYLENKISAGTNISIATINPGANEQLQITATDTNDKSKVSSNDTTTNYLENKVVAGTNISITVLNDGANEQLSISAVGSGLSDEQVKVSSNDTTANYLQSKLTAGTNVSIAVVNEGANEQLQITASGGATADELVKVSSNDTTANYLENKILAGTNVTVTVLNDGANEQLRISSSGGGTGSPIDGKDEGTIVASGITFIDFAGPMVTASPSSTGLLVTISGYSSPFIGAKTYRTSDFQLSTSTGWQNIDWQTSEYESDSTMWSTGAAVYVREAGYYSIVAQATISGIPTGNLVQLGLFKNAGIVGNIWDGYYTTTSGNRSLTIPYQGLLAANDYFVVQILNAAGTQPYVVSGVANSFFSIHKIHGQIAPITADPKATSVYMGGATYVSVNNTTETPITYNTETYDTGSYWSAGENTKFYAQETGYYHIDAGAAWETIYYHGLNPFQVKIGIRKNGSTILLQKWEWHDVNNGGARIEGLTTPVSGDIYLVAGDYIEVVVWHAKGSTASNIIRPDNYDTYCMIHRIQ